MRRSQVRRLGLAGGALITVLVGAIGIAEGQSGGRIEAGAQRESREEATRLARSVVPRRYSPTAVFAARPPYGRVAGLSTKRLAGFPRSGNSFLILSTGNVQLADNRNSRPDSGQIAGGPGIRGARDVTIFRFNLQVPRNRNCLSFRFRFLTEEFPEFLNQEFNDGFIAEIDQTTWGASSFESPRISAPRNFAFDSRRNFITVNGAGDSTVTRENARGTTYDGATRILRASTRVPSGKHRLYLSLFDQGDREFDSAVFVDRMTFSGSANCRTGVVVD